MKINYKSIPIEVIPPPPICHEDFLKERYREAIPTKKNDEKIIPVIEDWHKELILDWGNNIPSDDLMKKYKIKCPGSLITKLRKYFGKEEVPTGLRQTLFI